MQNIKSQCPSLVLNIEIAYGLDWSQKMEKAWPYITAALLCESVLQESNGTISIIRMADRAGYQPSQLPPGVRPSFKLSGLVGIKSGPVIGDHILKVVVENPVGARKEVFSLKVSLNGRDHGQNIILNMIIAAEHDGLHWFDVLFDEEVITRIPLTIAPDEPAVIQAPQQQ